MKFSVTKRMDVSVTKRMQITIEVFDDITIEALDSYVNDGLYSISDCDISVVNTLYSLDTESEIEIELEYNTTRTVTGATYDSPSECEDSLSIDTDDVEAALKNFFEERGIDVQIGVYELSEYYV